MPNHICTVCAVRGIERPAQDRRAIFTYPSGRSDLVWLCSDCVDAYDSLAERRRQAQRKASAMREMEP